MSTFKCIIKDTKNFRQMIEAIKEMNSDVNMTLSSEGIDINTLDDGHVSLCSLHYDSADFEVFCDAGKTFVIGLSLEQFLIILKTSFDKCLTLAYEEDGDVIMIMVGSESDELSEYELKLMQIECESLAVPEIEYDATAMYNSIMLSKIMSGFKLIADEVTIISDSDKETIMYQMSGDRINHKEIIKTETSDITNSLSLTFSLNYFIRFLKGSFFSQSLFIGISKDMPLVMSFTNKNSSIKYYLAPKNIENE